VRSTLDRLVADPSANGLRLHRVGPWLSVSPTMSLRILGMRERDGFCLVHVDEHDEAYRWGERHEPLVDQGSLLGIATGHMKQASADDAIDPELVGRLCDAGVPHSLARTLAVAGDDDALTVLAALAPELQEAALAALAGAPGAPASGRPSDIVVVEDDDALNARWRCPKPRGDSFCTQGSGSLWTCLESSTYLSKEDRGPVRPSAWYTALRDCKMSSKRATGIYQRS
jgi:hypothetical protein